MVLLVDEPLVGKEVSLVAVVTDCRRRAYFRWVHIGGLQRSHLVVMLVTGSCNHHKHLTQASEFGCLAVC